LLFARGDERVSFVPRLALTVAVFALLLAGAPGAGAAPALDGEFAVSAKPERMATGPDGNVWFTLSGGTNDFGVIKPDGTVTEFDVAAAAGVVDITAGPDNAIWMAGPAKVVRADPANPTAAEQFAIADIGTPQGIVTGPDGNIWAASDDKAIKISTAGVKLDTYTGRFTGARGIDAGGDGNLWVADFGGGAIVRVTTAGVATPFTVGGGPQEVAMGPAGQLAYSNPNSVFGRIAFDGTFETTDMPATDPFGIVFGDDGAYWSPQFNAHALARVTPTGDYTQLMLPAASGPRYIARGAGGTLWVGLQNTNEIARITGVTAPEEPPPPPPDDTTAPELTDLKAAPKRFRARAGSTLRFTLSEAATVAIVVERRRPGRRKDGRCVKPTRKLRKKPRCVRNVPFAKLEVPGVAGPNSIPLARKVAGKTLVPGDYRLSATPTDAAGNVGTRARAKFNVRKPKRR
jgi:streptogramin lyase